QTKTNLNKNVKNTRDHQMEEIEDRTMGVLLGLAAGDKIGGPIRMALRVAESLRDQDGFNIPTSGYVISIGGVRVPEGQNHQYGNLQPAETA
ncbi:MAG: hypothetical protein KAG93_05195, partial [Desulfuromusa sp.]|nr:hypothetical protein [Desulfuromusa sp.]